MKAMNFSISSIKPVWFLMAGIVSIALTHTTFSVDFLAWFSNVPFLIYLSLTKGLKSRLVFVLSLIAAWSVVVLKIVTPPIPYVMIFLFSVPISLIHLPAYLVWDKFKDHKWSVLLFPSILTVSEWLQYSFTPFASWGVMAYSQHHTLSLMQFVSVFGMPGLSFLVYWVNVSIVQFVRTKKATFTAFYLPALAIVAVIVYGSLRLDIVKSKGCDTLPVATIDTTSDVGGLPLPSKESNELVLSGLIERTRLAAASGAKLVVWTEGSFYALPADETHINDFLEAVARQIGISIVAAYVVPVSEKPFRYENKFVFIGPSGNVEYTYLKHKPVPGEPAIRGTESFKTIQVAESKVGGAICYDYDFPYIARAYGKLKADIVAVPSSDWRGIDPLHTRMAAFRAVEQGHSIIRSTRFGLSAAISPYGEIISQSSSFDTNSKIMIAAVPAKGFKTIYSGIGDVFIFLCIGFISLFVTIQIIRR